MDLITKFPSDSKIWGPGVWWTIHIQAKHATDHTKIQNFIKYIKFILPRLPCMKCREHATAYLKQNPIEEYLNMKDKNGLFEWSRIFHNAVNIRLGKQHTYDYDTAWSMYEDDEFCTMECGN